MVTHSTRPADRTFANQDVILIEFINTGGNWRVAHVAIDIDCIKGIITDFSPLLFALTTIKNTFSSSQTSSYAIVLLNENNCYTIGCADITQEAIQLIHNIQSEIDFDTGFHWEIRTL
jgi:hypothetical protein